MQRQMTGAHPLNLSTQVQMQPTGFPQAFQPTQPFQASQPFQATLSPHAPQHRPFSAFLQQQATGFQPTFGAGMLQPQPTAVNPFRQSMLLPQATGMAAFAAGSGNAFVVPSQTSVQPNPTMTFQTPMTQAPSSLQPFGPASQPQQPLFASPGGQTGPRPSVDVPTRPASTPLTAFGTSSSSVSPPVAQPVKAHQTGSRNPFGVPVVAAPPVPKPPTLLELSMGLGKPLPNDKAAPQQPQPTGFGAPESSISSVASSFAFSKTEQNSFSSGNSMYGVGLNPQMTGATMTTTTGTAAPESLFSSFTPLSSQPTGATVTSSSPSVSAAGANASLKPQMTGFGGLRPFKPTSSFGAALLESLPPIPQSSEVTPEATGAPALTHSPTSSLPTNLNLGGPTSADLSNPPQNNTASGGLSLQPTGAPYAFSRLNGGSTVGVGLRPQATGAMGAANPFRATMFATPSTTMGMTSSFQPSTSIPQLGLNGSVPALGTGLGVNNNPLLSNFVPGNQTASKPFQPVQPTGPSLI